VKRALAIAAALLGATPAAADPTYVLRLATSAPDGTSWAREARALARDVAAESHGSIQVKWYLGGIAGDELEVARRIQRGQIDGIVSGGMLCERVAPSVRALHLTGVYPDRDAASWVASKLRPTFADEAVKSGFALLATIGLGPTVVFSREPIRDMADLRRARLWRWDLDDVGLAMVGEMGFHVTPLPLVEAGRAYDQGRVDGFLAIPTGALAFQWSAQARYLLQQDLDYLIGCMLVANRAMDELPVEGQQVLRSAAAKLQQRIEDLGRRQDEALMSGLFARQGLKPVAPSNAFRAEFLAAARAARERLGDKLVPRALMLQVGRLLEDYRVERAAAAREPR